jgi:hypothetical protein
MEFGGSLGMEITLTQGKCHSGTASDKNQKQEKSVHHMSYIKILRYIVKVKYQ